MHRFIYWSVVLVFIACRGEVSEKEQVQQASIRDSHVHIMSPELVNDWKAMGIPFSKSAVFYTNIDTIFNLVEVDFIDLIGMGYVFGNPEYYQGGEAYKRLQNENDFLFAETKKHPNKIRPFFTVDSMKEYALAEIERCWQKHKEAGLKLHFSTSGVYLTEPEHVAKVKPLLQSAAAKQLPVLLHFDNWHPKFGRRDVNILVDSILQDLPALELTIAHFGTSGGFNEKTKRVIDAFVEAFAQDRIPERHTILFDISAVALNKDSEGVSKLSNEGFRELGTYVTKLGMDKVIFGTDYPLYTANEYLSILTEKLGLSQEEIKQITQTNFN